MPSSKVRTTKRLRYFTGQMLAEDDFTDEQQYFLALMRRHSQDLHTWGVVAGLDVTQSGDREVAVSPGSGIDKQGRTIIIESPQRVAVDGGQGSHLVVSYDEGTEETDRSSEAENYSRTSEYAVLQLQPAPPAQDGSGLYLAKVELDAGGKIANINTSIRRLAGSLIAPLSVGVAQLCDGAVSLPKLHPALRTGWTRLPFKPSFFEESGARNFLIGVTKTRCDAQGAKGTMSIPVPPGANKLKSFVLAGARNSAKLNVELWRCGWNNSTKKADSEQLIPPEKRTILGAPFHVQVPIDKMLDPETNAVAIYVEAVGEAEINLVAAEFEWSL